MIEQCCHIYKSAHSQFMCQYFKCITQDVPLYNIQSGGHSCKLRKLTVRITLELKPSCLVHTVAEYLIHSVTFS